MHINILVKYMTAKCLQNQPDILWYKNGTDKMNSRHQREKKNVHMNWWWNYTLGDDIIIFYMNMNCHDWQIIPICIKKCDMQIHCASENKLSYWKKKNNSTKFSVQYSKTLSTLIHFEIFFPSYLTQFSTPNKLLQVKVLYSSPETKVF